jgi:hypothetical protein
VLKNCAANRNRWLSALPNVGPYIYYVKMSGFTRSSIYIYDISRLKVNSETGSPDKRLLTVFFSLPKHML